MDARTLEETLVRLSLDGESSRLVGGLRGFPVLAYKGRTIYACPKTVLVKGAHGKFVPQSGVRYVVGDESGAAAGDFAGRRCHTGPVDVTLEIFMERFGSFFDTNELKIEEPEDPFAGYFSPA